MKPFLAFGTLLFVAPLHAQRLPNSPPPTATGANPAIANSAANPGAALPATNPVNGKPSILILALDDLTVSSADLPFLAPAPITSAPVAPAPITPAPGAIAPIAPTPGTTGPVVPAPAPLIPAPIAPTTFFAPRVETHAVAQKQPKPDKDDGLFLPVPDPPTKVTPELLGAPGSPVAPAGQTAPSLTQVQPAILGRAGLTALGLRRELNARGFGEVQIASPDSPLVTTALEEKRLSTRVLDDIKRAMFALSAPGQPAPATLSSATRAASRIGQALGSRAVVVLFVGETTGQTEKTAAFTLFLADAHAETGEPIAFDEKGRDEGQLRDSGALTASGLLAQSLGAFVPIPPAQREALAQKHFLSARAAFEAGRLPIATDEINQATALDPARAELWVLQGQILESTDMGASAAAYRRAVELNAKDGQTWARLAAGYAYAPTPNWPRVLEAARKAIELGYDNADLRVAMATAQYGRATLFRRADRIERAEDAEAEAKIHLDRALELSPDNPSAVRILARALLKNRSFTEALQTLDRVAPRFPRDIELQTLYASALAGAPATGERQQDAFLTYARIWQLTGKTQVDLDVPTYRTLSEGFDRHVSGLGRTAATLTGGVEAGTLAQEAAFLQLTKLIEEMKIAETAIGVMRAPAGQSAEPLSTRQYAATLMSQALEEQKNFLETGQKLFRGRGLESTRNAITQINAARSAG